MNVSKYMPFKNFVKLIILTVGLLVLSVYPVTSESKEKYPSTWQTSTKDENDDKSNIHSTQKLELGPHLWMVESEQFNKTTAPTIVKLASFSTKLYKKEYFNPIIFFAFERGYKIKLQLEIEDDNDGEILSASM